MTDSLRLAFGTLTTWRVPPPRTITRTVAGRAMVLAPLVMVPLLALLGLAWWLLAGISAPPAVVAVGLVGALVLSTRAMHLDGLADTADGLSASYDRARALEVMKRSDIGPSGVVAIALAVAMQIAALTDLVAGTQTGAGAGPLALAGTAILASRQSLAWACHRSNPPASGGGLGATVGQSVSTQAVAASTFLLFVVSIGVCSATGLPWWQGPATVTAALLTALAVLARCRSRLGGMTGDVLGAGIEASLSISLATAAMVAG